ncbi:MAG: pantetheine-phosphate adenylyltransferase [Bacteroidaceae bacterium]|nr:pantetheine-phosphate adenylyltransferase [Bacteroidaceae bacterium]
MKRGIFPGTFDPFTIGHQAIVARALSLIDELVIGVGINESKKNIFSIDDRVEMIKELYRNNPRIQVLPYQGLTIDFARQINSRFIIRGVRNVADFEYEKMIAEINRKLGQLETIFLFSEPELAYISSSMVRELLFFKKDISSFIPKEINISNKLKK